MEIMWSRALLGSKFLIVYTMSFLLKVTGEIDFSVLSENDKGSLLEYIIMET